MRAKAIALVAILLFNCTAVRQQKALAPATDDLHFHNLQVLPQNLTRPELITTMKRFTQALGVGCDYCHAPGVGEELDFPSDARQTKHAARLMIRMVRQINEETISRVPDALTTVTCWTCHRGESQPAVVPSLPDDDEQ